MIDLILSHPDPNTRTLLLRAHFANVTRQTVSTCTACPLHLTCPRPVPFTGPATSPLAIISPYPSPLDEQTGLPLSGRERDILQTTLAEQTGLALSQVAIVHALSCRPPGAPHPSHFQSCAGNLESQIVASGAQVLLVLGPEALSALAPELSKLPWDDLRGRGWHESKTNRTYFVTDHPLTVTRSPKMLEQFTSDLRILGRLVQHRFVLRALEVFRSDFSWPRLIDTTLTDLDPRKAEEHRLRFCLRMVEETGGDSDVTRACQQMGLFEDEFDPLAPAPIDPEVESRLALASVLESII